MARMMNEELERMARDMRARDQAERKALDNVFFTLTWLAGGAARGGAIQVKPEWAGSLLAAAVLWDEYATKADKHLAMDRAVRIISEREN